MRRSARVFVLTFAAAVSASTQETGDVDAEFRRGYDLIVSGKVEEGIAAFEKVLEMAPAPPMATVATYNIACGWSLLKQKEKALEWFAKAFERGFEDFEQAGRDTDFDFIRAESAFAAIVEKMKKARSPLVLEPANHDAGKPAPALVVLHGHGGNKAEFAEAWKSAADELGYLVVSIPGTFRLPEGGYSWYESREAYRRSIGRYENPILDAVRNLKRERKIDEERVFLAGFSQGAFMAFQTGMRMPGLFRGVLGVAGAYDLGLAGSATKSAAGRGSRVVLLHGEKDAEVSAEAVKEVAKRLEAEGMKTKVVLHPGAHDFPADRTRALVEAIRWLERPGGDAPSKPGGGD